VQNAMQRAQQRILMADDEFIAATAPRPAGPGRPAGRARRAPIYESDVRLLLLTVLAVRKPAECAVVSSTALTLTQPGRGVSIHLKGSGALQLRWVPV